MTSKRMRSDAVRGILAIILFNTISVVAVKVHADCPEGTLFVEGTVGLDEFGTAIAISGDRAVVGAPSEADGPNGRLGAAYVFRRSSTGWMLEARLSPSEPAAGSEFGRAVAIDGKSIVVGAPGQGGGSAHVFTLEQGVWVEQEELSRLVPDGGTTPEGTIIRVLSDFGQAAAISGDRIVVGGPNCLELVPSEDPNDPTPVQSHGAAYVFERIAGEWRFEDSLATFPSPWAGAFGWSVSIDGETIAIGSPQGSSSFDPSHASGMVHIYAREAGLWGKQAGLNKPEGGSIIDWDFGISIALHGDTLLAGSPGGDAYPAVFVYERTAGEWSHQATLTAEQPTMLDDFGLSVALGEDTAVVTQGFGRWPIVFNRTATNWQPKTIAFSAPEATPGPVVVHTVAIDGRNLMMGTPMGDYPIHEGTSYVLNLDQGEGDCGATPNDIPPPPCSCGVCPMGQALLMGLSLGIIGCGRRRVSRRRWQAPLRSLRPPTVKSARTVVILLAHQQCTHCATGVGNR